ncbi:ferric reductase-like transmembrane domain-containing protein [Nocardioides sp. TRM66260-LWL]|uniref:ferredoxin reductase family protein n=1 Tax=Nocardioides sp. TRM66260-LWL TaxID=2874478 RepID=UPI001CC77DA7|nr:ferric reductase-like transmembrane domain-containing protein [Nocardioides sp. TRM66260-LWL]MBZ5735790.1 ferric reductase-like transmembrane domain-containing protein [Nocardioides sp. TRM66260-LWL]
MATLTRPATPRAAAARPRRTVPVGLRSRRDAAVRLAAVVSLWSGLLLVTWWWTAAGGVQELGGWASGLTSAGRLTGLWSSLLLLVQVLLMARVPVLERAFGQDELARVHRLVGFTSFTLMVAHIGLITWGYAAGSLAATPGTLWDLTVTYPGMLLAAAGTVCLVLVVVTSVKAARRRLRYESWHLLHLYAYLGVGLALPHQLWTGTELVSSPGRTVFWWSLWGAAAGAVVVWRVLLPLVRTLRLGLRVEDVVREAPGIVSVHVAGPGLARLRVEAGQFLTWRFLGRDGWTRANPYSLSAAPDGRRLRITVQDVGDGSGSLATLRRGSRVAVEGPYGRLSARARTTRRVALIGAGVGIAPLRALAEGLDYAPGEAALLYRFTDQPLFRAELDELARTRGLQVVPLAGRRRHPDSWLGELLPEGAERYRDVDVVRGWVPDLLDRDVFVCGPAAWAERLRDDLLRAGLPPERLHDETFGW